MVMHLSHQPWGIGTNKFKNKEMAALRDEIKEVLKKARGDA